jgi:peptidoglycan/xylan/chitin deacetylase (PgdA/CDA1 family)
MNPLFASLFALLSPAGAKARLSVLIFHRVLPKPDPLFPGEVDAAQFDAMLGWLRRWFQVLPLDEATARLKAGTLPSRAAAITFDDGYADNHDVALPLLKQHGLSATFFIATGFLGGGRMFNDSVIETVRRCRLAELDVSALGLGRHGLGELAQRQTAIQQLIRGIKYLELDERRQLTERIAEAAQVELPTDLMMSPDQVRALRAAGMQIGAHTVNHPILARLDLDTAGREIAESRRYLEDLLGERVGLFAYPNGKPGSDYLPEQARLVESLGFEAAVTTAWGAARQGCDPFQIPRFTPWDRSRARFGLRLARNFGASGGIPPIANAQGY